MTCNNALVTYYPSKGVVMVETEVGGPDNIPIIAKKKQCYSFTWRGESYKIKSGYTLNCQHTEQNYHCKRYVWKLSI